ncbi:hypothetical protein M3Y99_00913500 [Aphelenchoides fujianensis]|nr:hypothetical protein M3Y99_00913500 [Aphelenchoides fujianensis]
MNADGISASSRAAAEGSKGPQLAIASFLLVVGVILLLLLHNVPFSEKRLRVEKLRFSLQIPGRPAASENQSTTPPAECLCGGENFCFSGLDETGAVRWGRRFDCELLGALRAARLTDEEAARTPLDAARIDANDQWNPVFVTATSSNHFSELRSLIRLLHSLYPKSRIVETLQVHKTFFWFDTSVRPAGRHLAEFLRGVLSGHLPPFSTHTARTHHSVFASTHPGMFTYLPLPPLVLQLTEMESSFQFVSDAPYTRYVFKWWLLCAMTRGCIAPKGAQKYCRTREPKKKYRTYMKCHRFDQTTSNTIDCVRPYSRFVARDGGERPADVWSEREVRAAIKRKKSAMLLAISNCSPHFAPSGRLAYAAALERHIAVTRVGGCFGRRVSDEELAALVADHHFFLAFENSVCPEYTTEKFWRLNDLIVPLIPP